MRTRTIARWRRAALGGAMGLFLSIPARAQQDQPPPPPPPLAPQAQEPAAEPQDKAQAPQEKPAKRVPHAAQPARENAPMVTEQSPRPAPDANIKPVPGAPDEYTIQKGDTLWDLSQKFLSNPWYWPKIWSLNPSIENPHWIYPGNKLRIVPGEGGEQAPAQVQEETEAGVDATAMNSPEEPQPGASPDTLVSPPETPDLDVVSKNSREGRSSQNSVTVSGKLAFSPPPVITVRTSGLITPEEMREAGTLEASFEEKEMLATYDTAYARFRGEVTAKPGDKVLIFRPEGNITHPISHRTLGRQTKTVAVAKILSVQGTQATIQIERMFEEVGRGDLVRPWTAQDKRVAPRANTADVVGRIVQSVDPGLTTYGEANEVFIDRGSEDGVQEGNTFAVVRQGDGLSNAFVTQSYTAGVQGEKSAKADVPEENVGLLLVVDTREHLSTAVVVKSVRELQAGDMVEMRASGSGGGAQ
ncbi:MAG TPA: LysM peptidoglycan-binding domain-containing protein [Myxococcales bacterium]|nr:LysM peptidoglycan-binding domain-containing protein [Myxococcales bacterium]